MTRQAANGDACVVLLREWWECGLSIVTPVHYLIALKPGTNRSLSLAVSADCFTLSL